MSPRGGVFDASEKYFSVDTSLSGQHKLAEVGI